MSALGGPRLRRRAALLVALAAGLAGCQYADDVGLAPTVPDTAQTQRDAHLAATVDRNTAELERVLGATPDGLIAGGTGGVGTSATGGFRTTVQVTEAGRYTVTAACIGVPGTQLTVTQGSRQGGTASILLELNHECGGAASSEVSLEAGSASAHVVRLREGSADPGAGAVAGVRISRSGPAP